MIKTLFRRFTISEQPLTETPGQESDVEAASELLYVEAADEIIGQTTRLDIAALLTLGLVVVLFHVLVPSLRTSSQVGSALRLDSLRKVVTVILAFLSLALFVGEQGQRSALRWMALVILELYTLYVATYTFLGLDLLTDSILPTLAEYAALLSAIVLWQPWRRLRLYRKSLNALLPALILAAAVLLLWEGFVKAFNIKGFLLPAPSVVANTFMGIYPGLVSKGWLTFQNAFWGFAVGCGLGILFGLLTSRFIGFSRAMMPYAIAVNCIPIIAYAPITNAWFGVLNPLSKISIVAVLTFFPAMINTVRGLTSTDSATLELMRSYAATELEIFRKVRLPMALPYIFSALKVATTLSMIGAIVAEYFGGPTTGLGVSIVSDAALIRFPLVWSEIIIASALGIIFYFVVSLVERLVMPWHVSFRAEQ